MPPGFNIKLSIEIEREDDGRGVADVMARPGALAYGAARDEAIARAEALALRILADLGGLLPTIAHEPGGIEH